MDKSKAELVGLVLFSLLTAGIGQAMILTSAPVPASLTTASQDAGTQFPRPRTLSLPVLKDVLGETCGLAPLPDLEQARLTATRTGLSPWRPRPGG